MNLLQNFDDREAKEYDMENVIDIIKSIVEDSVRITKPISQIKTNENLFNIGMDSTSSIRIVVALEERFDFSFEDEKLTFETLHTIDNIYEYVIQKIHSD